MSRPSFCPNCAAALPTDERATAPISSPAAGPCVAALKRSGSSFHNLPLTSRLFVVGLAGQGTLLYKYKNLL